MLTTERMRHKRLYEHMTLYNLLVRRTEERGRQDDRRCLGRRGAPATGRQDRQGALYPRSEGRDRGLYAEPGHLEDCARFEPRRQAQEEKPVVVAVFSH